MLMPIAYDDDLLKLNCNTASDLPTPRQILYSIVYPPLGYFPFLQTDNGDSYGYYWPIGKESEPPLIAYSSHDAFALIPVASDLPTLARSQLALDNELFLDSEFLTRFKSTEESPSVEDPATTLSALDHRALLAMDPTSPFRNCAAADLDVAEEKWKAAEEKYLYAIEKLPEYGSAHFGLGYLLRRTGRLEEATIYLRKALICPRAFGGDAFWGDHTLPGNFRGDWYRKALTWLQATKTVHPILQNDPMLAVVRQLKLKAGISSDDDIILLTSLVETYTNRGDFLDAIYLWLNIGDLAAMETTSFRERHALTKKGFIDRLSSLLLQSGNIRRASLLADMMTMIDSPTGLHL